MYDLLQRDELFKGVFALAHKNVAHDQGEHLRVIEENYQRARREIRDLEAGLRDLRENVDKERKRVDVLDRSADRLKRLEPAVGRLEQAVERHEKLARYHEQCFQLLRSITPAFNVHFNELGGPKHQAEPVQDNASAASAASKGAWWSGLFHRRPTLPPPEYAAQATAVLKPNSDAGTSFHAVEGGERSISMFPHLDGAPRELADSDNEDQLGTSQIGGVAWPNGRIPH